MGELFNRWRLKLGVLTLALAIVFMGGWIRSPMNIDSVQFEWGPSVLTFASNQNGLWWVTSELPGRTYQPSRLGPECSYWSLPGHRSPFSDDPFGHLKSWNWGTEQRWDWCGFHFGQFCNEDPFYGIRLAFRIVPHWAVVWPLTLISAYLLCSRPVTFKKNVETS